TAVPAILDLWHNRGIVPIIAEPLAKLVASGRLDADDPALAAQHLSALTFGQVNNASMMGDRPAQRRRSRPHHHHRQRRLPARLRPARPLTPAAPPAHPAPPTPRRTAGPLRCFPRQRL